MASSNKPRKAIQSSTEVTGQISKRLKEYYRSVEEEAIPDKFLDLLEKLDAAEQKTKAQDGESQ